MSTTSNHSVSYLKRISRDLFTAAGTPENIAETVAEVVANANLAGHDSHGVQFVPMYLDRIEKGQIAHDSYPEIVRESRNTLHVDGHNGFGHYMSRKAMEWSIERARRSAVCCVTFQNTTHIGRVGEYAEQAAAAGCIALITLGGADAAGSQVVPFGGARGALGTNPIAVGIPTGDDAPFVIDMATSVIAGGKIVLAASKGQEIPEGVLVDSRGYPTTRPQDLNEGGFMLPFGGHKGYALSLFFSLMGGLAGDFNAEMTRMAGLFMQVYDVGAFTSLEAYQANVRAVLDAVKDIPPRTGLRRSPRPRRL